MNDKDINSMKNTISGMVLHSIWKDVVKRYPRLSRQSEYFSEEDIISGIVSHRLIIFIPKSLPEAEMGVFLNKSEWPQLSILLYDDPQLLNAYDFIKINKFETSNKKASSELIKTIKLSEPDCFKIVIKEMKRLIHEFGYRH